MKYLVVFCAVLHLCYGRSMPDYLQQYLCHKSDPDFAKCVLDGFEKTKPLFAKGIPELNVPPLDPFELPLMTVNRSINNGAVTINAVCRNVKVLGGGNYIIDDLKADVNKRVGEIRVTLPWTYLDMDYDVTGQLLTIPLKSEGHFQGNFTDTQIAVRASFKLYKRDGVEYFKINKFASKMVVGDGHIKLISKNPDFQLGADIITNFYNENPRRVMDAINPIFVETANELFRVVSDQILARLPASEWLPE